MWTRILQIGGILFKIVKNKKGNKENSTKKAVFTWYVLAKPKCNCSAITFHLSLCDWPYCTSSSRNLPVQKDILFSPKIRSDTYCTSEIILSGNIHREDSDWKSMVSIAFHYCFTEKCSPLLYKHHFYYYVLKSYIFKLINLTIP